MKKGSRKQIDLGRCIALHHFAFVEAISATAAMRLLQAECKRRRSVFATVRWRGKICDCVTVCTPPLMCPEHVPYHSRGTAGRLWPLYNQSRGHRSSDVIVIWM